MADRMSPEALKSLLESQIQFAFIDIREAGEYNTSHIPGASLLSRRHLEFQMPLAVPHQDTHVILCDTMDAGCFSLQRRWSVWATAMCPCSTVASIAG